LSRRVGNPNSIVVKKSSMVDFPASFGPLTITKPGDRSSTPKSARPPKPSTWNRLIRTAIRSASAPVALELTERKGERSIYELARLRSGGLQQPLESVLVAKLAREPLGQLGREVGRGAILGGKPAAKLVGKSDQIRGEIRPGPRRLEVDGGT